MVIVSPGGFPRDIDLYQSQKACACAELACRPGGEIILCAAAPDGVGTFAKVLAEAGTPQEVIDRYTREGFGAESTAKAYMYARAPMDHRLCVACSSLNATEAERMFMNAFTTLDEAIADALERYGRDARFLAVPNAAEMMITQPG